MEIIYSPHDGVIRVERSFYSQSLGKLLTTKPKQSTHTYSRIQQQTKNPYYATIHNEYVQENPRINRQDLLTPRRSPNSALPLHTQKQCTARGFSWGSSIPVSDHYMLLDPPWGEGRQTSRQPTNAAPPTTFVKSKTISFLSQQCENGEFIFRLYPPISKYAIKG